MGEWREEFHRRRRFLELSQRVTQWRTPRVSLYLEGLTGPLTERDVRHAIDFLTMVYEDFKEDSSMGETVTIPAGTLIHVGGLPFRTTVDTVVSGSEANLKLGLEALAESMAASNTGEVGSTQASA